MTQERLTALEKTQIIKKGKEIFGTQVRIKEWGNLDAVGEVFSVYFSAPDRIAAKDMSDVINKILKENNYGGQQNGLYSLGATNFLGIGNTSYGAANQQMKVVHVMMKRENVEKVFEILGESKNKQRINDVFKGSSKEFNMEF